jgi:hypothetical protein
MVSLLSTFVFFGCATSTPTIAPDGTQAISIRCGGLSPDSCVVKAGEVCPSGYEVLSSNDAKYLGQVGTSSVSGSWSNYGGGVLGSASSLPVISANTILIRCKTIPFVAPIAKENATRLNWLVCHSP